MFKLRTHLSAIFILCSVVCAVWALPPLTTSQQKAKAKCDSVFNQCFQGCNHNNGGQDRCIDALAQCYGKIGIQAPPRNRLSNGKVPQGTLTQASPTATPSTRQPSSLTPLKKLTPTPTPTPHQSPAATFKKKKSDH
jgi:hypothetical protein